MNLSTVKLLVSGMLLLFLSACAPYHQTYYPAGGAYSGYGVTQRSYYSRYPYRYDNHAYPYNSNYRDNSIHRYDGYNSQPSRNRSYVMPIPSNDYSHNRPDRKHQQFGYQGSVPAYPDRKNHHDLLNNNNWSKPSTDRSWEHNNLQHGRPNSDLQNHGQNQRSHDNRGNQIKKQRHYDHENDKHVHYENHEQAKNQRESRR